MFETLDAGPAAAEGGAGNRYVGTWVAKRVRHPVSPESFAVLAYIRTYIGRVMVKYATSKTGVWFGRLVQTLAVWVQANETGGG